MRRASSQGRRRPVRRDRWFSGLTGAVLDAALDAVVLSDRDGRVLAFNPAAQRLLGHGSADAATLLISDLIVVPHGVCTALGDRDMLGILGKRIELDGRRADGTTFPAELAVQRVALRGRTGFAAYLRDLSAQRRAEADLAESRRRLGEIEKLSAMGSLLAGVAHELNNPLAILVAQATLLRERAPDPDVARRAERIHDAAQRAGRILRGFLAMARQRPPVREIVDLNAAVEDALELLAYDLKGAEIAVERDLAPDLPPVEADRDLIGQALVHLLSNARLAVVERDGGRRVTVRTRAADGSAVLLVADNGAGVPPDVAGRVFDPYFTTRAPGTALGVGLSLARGVAQAHGGALAIEPRPEGDGACFRLSLPASAAVRSDGPEPSGLSILVVDDEAEVAEALAELAALFGHRAEVETDPLALAGKLRGRRFDAIFVDLRMPALDGLTLRQQIAEADPALGARTVIMTGDTFTPARDDGMARRLADALVLEKPFTASSVRAMLEKVARR